MSNPLLVERAGHVETWTLNLPASRNPISGDGMVGALVAAAHRVDQDRTVRAVILTGSGSAFSTGGNIKDMADRTGMFGGTAHDLRAAYRDGIQRIPRALHACEVPLIAAVNGPAVGAGCDLAMMCDLRLAAPSAFFAESFVKLGVIPGDGGAWFLPRVVGAARAAEMVLTGDRVDADTALAWGLVSRVVPAEELLEEARTLADRIAVNPPQAVRMAKRLLRDSQLQSLDATLELSAAMQGIAHQTDDHAEAVAAFLERRDPQFTGK
ncbi:crotonase/enoyl-CoA hydratase family protein [Pseudonocardia sp.]|uniref:crotonase/enoyl-CoA hydratase family protein n=1 Tax=Pseudonocardia sp. TaxID=60912 RepID=UPI0031FE1A18